MTWEQTLRKYEGGTSFSLFSCSSWTICQKLTFCRKYWGVFSVPPYTLLATPFWERLCPVTQPNLGQLAQCIAKPNNWRWVLMMKGTVSHKAPSTGSGVENGQLILQRPELPDGFWGRVLKTRASLVVQMVNNLLVMQETRLRPLDQEDPLEKRMPTHSSDRGWEIPWTKGAWWATVHGVAKSRTRLSDWLFHFKGKVREFGVGGCKLLHLGWISSRVLMDSTRNYIQYPVINHNGKQHKKERMYHVHNWVTLLDSRGWRNIINQLYVSEK